MLLAQSEVEMRISYRCSDIYIPVLVQCTSVGKKETDVLERIHLTGIVKCLDCAILADMNNECRYARRARYRRRETMVERLTKDTSTAEQNMGADILRCVPTSITR